MPHFMALPQGWATWKLVRAKPSGEMSTPEPPPCPPAAKIASTAGLALAMTAIRCDSACSTAGSGGCRAAAGTPRCRIRRTA